MSTCQCCGGTIVLGGKPGQVVPEFVCHGFHAETADPQTIGPGNTKITFGSTLFNVGLHWDAVGQIWTPPKGLIQCGGAVRVDTLLLTERIQAFVRKNGAAFKAGSSAEQGGTGFQNSTVVFNDLATGTDTYELFVARDVGSTALNTSTVQTYFWGHGVGLTCGQLPSNGNGNGNGPV